MNVYEHLTSSDLNNEIWYSIDGYQNYMISNCGRVKSLNYNHTRKEKILVPLFNSDGYLHVKLYKNNKVKTITVHRLVASSFIENSESKPQVNHKNGIKTDNRSQNLEWTTAKENTDHAWCSGLNENVRGASILSNTGENNGLCKISDVDCEEIRLRYSNGNISQKELAEEYGCAQQQISRIINHQQRIKKTFKT